MAMARWCYPPAQGERQRAADKAEKRNNSRAMLLRSHASALAALSLACCPSVRSAPHSHNEWAVVFDGGSTGTRVYVYEYTLVPGGLPSLHAEKAWNLKVKPGLSSFSDRPREVGSGYLTSLLDFAAGIVPRTKQARAKVLLRATAGMRLVPTEAAEVIYDSLFAAVRAHGAFQPERSLFGTLSGEDEGVFGWLSVNQLLVSAERLPASKLGQVGALDLGGGSTQITFATARGAAAAASAPLPGREVPAVAPAVAPSQSSGCAARLFRRRRASRCLSSRTRTSGSATSRRSPH